MDSSYRQNTASSSRRPFAGDETLPTAAVPTKRSRLDQAALAQTQTQYCNPYYCNVDACKVHHNAGGYDDEDDEDYYGEDEYDDGAIEVNPYDWHHDFGLHIQWFLQQRKRMDVLCKQAENGYRPAELIPIWQSQKRVWTMLSNKAGVGKREGGYLEVLEAENGEIEPPCPVLFV